MGFKTHNDISLSAGGTFLQGYVTTDYANIVRVFGKPIACINSYKVDAEWIIRFDDGEIATIYNYKTGKNYCGSEGLDVEDIETWHIGGNHSGVESRISLLLSENWGGFDSIRQDAVSAL